jgi:hypothetical protein
MTGRWAAAQGSGQAHEDDDQPGQPWVDELEDYPAAGRDESKEATGGREREKPRAVMRA